MRTNGSTSTKSVSSKTSQKSAGSGAADGAPRFMRETLSVRGSAKDEELHTLRGTSVAIRGEESTTSEALIPGATRDGSVRPALLSLPIASSTSAAVPDAAAHAVEQGLEGTEMELFKARAELVLVQQELDARTGQLELQSQVRARERYPLCCHPLISARTVLLIRFAHNARFPRPPRLTLQWKISSPLEVISSHRAHTSAEAGRGEDL